MPCALAAAGSVVPGLDHAVTAALFAVIGLAALVGLAQIVARWVRERREDRADALTAAAWRAQNAPHLLTEQQRQLVGLGVA